MVLIAAALIALALGGLYAHHTHLTDQRRLSDTGLRESEYLRFIQALGEIHEAILAIELPPVDLSSLAMTDRVTQLLHEHMDTIQSEMEALSTRVETGPGRRKVRIP